MARRAVIVLASLAVNASLAGRASPADAGWRLAAVRTLEHQATYAGFLDARAGITVGLHGLVAYTTDGGATWIEGRNVSDCRSALELLPDGFAWHAGTVQVNRSFNGGRTWYRVAGFQGAGMDLARSLSFADENRGLVATDRRLYATEDGGLHWHALALPAGVDEIAAVSLALRPSPSGAHEPTRVTLETTRPVIARVLDRTGRLWVTEDGGARWTPAESPLAGMRFQVAARAPTAFLRFTPSGEGAVTAFVEEGGRARCRLWRRDGVEDGWSEEAVPLEEPGTLFPSPDARVLTWKSADRDEVRVYVRDARGGAR